MKKRLIFIFTLLLSGILALQAQEKNRITVRGTVVDERTGEPVAFANLGLLGTVAGAASDMDGRFEFSVPDRYATHVLRFTAVGYASAEMKLYEAKSRQELVVKLRPVTYGIGAVDVYGQLLIYKKMLRNVVANMGRNYITEPYSYEGYFRHGEKDGEKVSEAVVTIYDSEGYTREDTEAAFRHLNYGFNQVRRSSREFSPADGLTRMDDILTADVVRHTRNVLDITNSRDYTLKNKGTLVFEGDSVQVIGYSLARPSISTTGDAAVSAYEGEIYVNLKDWAVVRNVVRIRSTGFNTLGRNLVTVDGRERKDVRTTVTTSYKKLRSVYVLGGISMEYSYTVDGQPCSGKMDFTTTRVRVQEPRVVTGRRYYEDKEEDKEFWERYSVYLEEEL